MLKHDKWHINFGPIALVVTLTLIQLVSTWMHWTKLVMNQ